MNALKKKGLQKSSHQWRLCCHVFLWRALIKPVSFLDHLEGRKGLLCLIVIVELPRQIGDQEQWNDDRGDDPERMLAGQNGRARLASITKRD